jgi:hypothetical protein
VTQVRAERVGCGDDERAELVESGSTCEDGAFAGIDKYAKCLALSRGARRGLPLLAERFPCRFDRVE